MARSAGTGLARVTIAAPRRRVDVALPDSAPVQELLPALLRHAGEELADDGQAHSGWVLRKADGSAVDGARALAAQEILDGEVLHLVPRRLDWPEMDYDDVVDAIATGGRRQTRTWAGAATRRTGGLVGAGVALGALALLVGTGPPWGPVGIAALLLALLWTAAAVALARAVADSGTAALLGAVAMVCAVVGGGLVARGTQPLDSLDAPQVLAGAAALMVVALLGYGGVADRTTAFVSGTALGLVGVAAALLALTDTLDAQDVAAIMTAVVVALTPVAPLLSIRLGRLPMPLLPSTAEDLLADPPPTPPARVEATVRRTDEVLTGLLWAGTVISALAAAVLVGSPSGPRLLLVGVVALATLLRARLFPAVRQRLPLLVSGLVMAAVLGTASVGLDPGTRRSVLVPALTLLAGAVVAAGLYFRRRRPSPYFGRFADVLDVLLILSVVPLTCWAAGLFGYLRGIGG